MFPRQESGNNDKTTIKHISNICFAISELFRKNWFSIGNNMQVHKTVLGRKSS